MKPFPIERVARNAEISAAHVYADCELRHSRGGILNRDVNATFASVLWRRCFGPRRLSPRAYGAAGGFAQYADPVAGGAVRVDSDAIDEMVGE